MKICQKHWDKLRKEIDDKGLSHLIAKNGKDAIKNIVEGEPSYDPLMAANMMIWERAIKSYGLEIMNREDGKCCPICFDQEIWIGKPIKEGSAELLTEEYLDNFWIVKLIEFIHSRCIEKGLVPPKQ